MHTKRMGTQLMSINTAMILAAGRGERLRPRTDSVPKPLIQVGKHKLIEYHLFSLARSGINRVVVNISHLGQQIVDFLGDGARYGVDILYSWERDGALETAGGIQQALELLDCNEFLVVNGDIFTDMDFSTLVLPDAMAMHLVLVDNPLHKSEGDFSIIESRVSHLAALPAAGMDTFTFSGIGLYRSDVFQELTPGSRPLAPLIRRHIECASVSAVIFDGLWIDVGTEVRLKHARLMAQQHDNQDYED